jgi:hypothetical protein
MCGAVSQDLPEIQGDIALPKGDATRSRGHTARGAWLKVHGRGHAWSCRHGRDRVVAVVVVASSSSGAWLKAHGRGTQLRTCS